MVCEKKRRQYQIVQHDLFSFVVQYKHRISNKLVESFFHTYFQHWVHLQPEYHFRHFVTVVV
jgi:hypothetical protein